MQGEQLDGAHVSVAGLVGDRAYALLDGQTGKVASATHPKLWPELIACRATFVESPLPGRQLPAIRIELADGTAVRSDAADVDAVLSRFFGRPVELARAAPKDFTIDQYHPDIENLDPEGHRNELTEQKLGTALLNELGMPWRLPDASFLDLAPVSVITTSTLDHLGALQPDSTFDARRFRMNVVVNTTEPGFVENDWVDHALHLGDQVRLFCRDAGPPLCDDDRCAAWPSTGSRHPQEPRQAQPSRRSRLGAVPMRRDLRHGRVPGDDPEGRAGHGGVRPNS